MSSEKTASDESFEKALQELRNALDSEDAGNAAVAACKVFELSAEMCDENPTPESTLTEAARQYEERGDWCSAESSYQRILDLPNIGPMDRWRAHSNLARLYRLLNRESEALEQVRHASQAIRCESLPILLAGSLEAEAWELMRREDTAAASIVISEALAVIEGDKMYNQMRASLLTVRAASEISNQALSDAERDLEQAHSLIQPLAKMDFAAGVQSDIAVWWSVVASLHSARNEPDQAISAWQNAVNISKHVASLPQVDSVYPKRSVAMMLKGLANALLSGDRAVDATKALGELKEILANIGVPAAAIEQYATFAS